MEDLVTVKIYNSGENHKTSKGGVFFFFSNGGNYMKGGYIIYVVCLGYVECMSV